MIRSLRAEEGVKGPGGWWSNEERWKGMFVGGVEGDMFVDGVEGPALIRGRNREKGFWEDETWRQTYLS